MLYYKSIFNQFLNWDDEAYVVLNNDIKNFSLDSFKNYFTKPYVACYLPLTMISYNLEFYFFGLNPECYHFTNLILHLINVALVFIFIYKISLSTMHSTLYTQQHALNTAFIVALLFGIHPMHVESVAWISERKDLLYSLFYLTSLIFYLNYISNLNVYFQKPKTKLSIFNYPLSIIFFILSLLSKPMAISLPLILFLIDYYYKRNLNFKIATPFRSDGTPFKQLLFRYPIIIEKLPYIILSFCFGIIVIFNQKDNIEKLSQFNFFDRFILLAFSSSLYLIKSIIPFKLSAQHDFPVKIHELFPIYIYIISFAFLFALIFFIYKTIFFKHKDQNTGNRVLIFGSLFFFFTISIVLQILSYNDSFISERYTYIPYIGLFYIIAYSILKFFESSTHFIKIIILITALLYFIILSAITFERISVWHDSKKLWTDVIMKYPKLYLGYFNNGVDEFHNLEYKEAIADFSNAIHVLNTIHRTMNTDFLAKSYYYRAEAEKELSDFNPALIDLNSAINTDEKYFEAYCLRADLQLYIFHKDSAALSDYILASKLHFSPHVFFKIGNLMFDKKEMSSACLYWHKAKYLGYPEADYKLKLYCK